MSILDECWFSHISRPSRYIGREVNSIRKDPFHAEVSIALVFPDTYEVGMSHLGLKILYHILNSHHWLAAERAFPPWIDLEKELRHRNISPTTLESDRPLGSFDIIGFSLQHELSYTNVLNMLDLSRIPPLSKDRSDEDPLVIAGGPACFNPEPVAEFFDVMVIGDGEEAALEICQTLREAKQRKKKIRRELLSQLCHIKGVYVPSYFNIHYRPDGPVDMIEPIVSDYQVIEKAILANIDDFPHPDSQVVPFAELVHDRLAIEISRGCTRGCRFCQAGMVYRPVRERGPESILKKAEKALSHTGYEELSLLSLSSGDYSSIEPLLEILMNRQLNKKVAVSLPSLRVDTLSHSLMEQIKRVRKTGFTLAPEAGSHRLRRIINKGLNEEDILKMAKAVYGAGWNLIKLYFMIGLPFEEEKDLQDIVHLSRKFISEAGKRARLNLSISTFVPKSHTPFMWVAQIPLEESQRRIRSIVEGLKGKPVRVKWNDPEQSWLEGVFSRGDRRLSKVLIEAWKLGAKFDAWGEHFKPEVWRQAFKRTGVDPHFYLHRERSLDEVLPWDHIRSGIRKGYLIKEWKKAQREEFTPDCREECLECGVCDHKVIDPILFKGWDSTHSLKKYPAENIPSPSRRYRLTFTKLGHAKYLGHLELVRVFVRAIKRAGLNIVYSTGYHPMPKISFACALPVGTESMQETAEIQLGKPSNILTLKENINRQLPSGISVTFVEEMAFAKKKEQLKESHFLITLNGVELKEDGVTRFLRSDNFPIVKANKKGEHKINARALVKSMSLISPNEIKLVVKHTSGPESRPAEIVKNVFSLSYHYLNEMKILKTKQVLG